MASLSPAAPERAAAKDGDRISFTAMGALVALLVLAGFARTYYLVGWFEPPARMPRMNAILHLHEAAFTAWIALQAVQPPLVALGRRDLHRLLG